MQNKHAITHYFLTITDPRIDRQKLHKLIDIIVIAICGVLAGCDSWVEIEDFGHDRESWLKTFLELPGGIPSHDTFGRVFSLINPKQFQRAFATWMQAAVERTEGLLKTIAVDGKTNRRTFGGKTEDGFTRALHMVSAFASANGITLCQVATDQKSNEITAIPELLDLLDLHGCLVTTDALGCQADIAADIIDRGGDYLLAVKGNQRNLYRDIQTLFADVAIPRDTHTTEDTGHGRIDKRTCEVITGPIVLERLRHNNNWVNLQTIVKVTAERTVLKRDTNQTSAESRYYICSVVTSNTARIQQAVREHWGIENKLHWSLDMTFREDESRIRTGHAPANMAVLRHIAMNLLRQDKTRKIGLKASRLKAARSTAYLEKLLGCGNGGV